MEVTNQGDVRIDLKLGYSLTNPQQMKGDNRYGKQDENNIFLDHPHLE